MKISGYITKDDNDGTPAEVRVEFYDDEQTKVLHAMTVIVEHPDEYYDVDAIVKFGAYRAALEEVIPKLQGLLNESLKSL